MTLIVGLRTPKRIQLLSDTRISHPDVTQIEEVPGRLKLVALVPYICVGYAGPTNRAIDVIRSLANVPGIDFDQVVSTLEEASRDGEIDFIGATSRPEMRLVRVTTGYTTEVPSECWIGDAEGAAAFRTRRLTKSPPPSSDPEIAILSPAITAFGAILRERVVQSVGGLCIRVSSRPKGFKYLDEATAYFPSQTIPSGIRTALRFGNAAEGGYAYSLLVPEQPGIPIVAVHFLQGHLGFVYAPLRQDRPITVPDVSHSGLQEYVSDTFGYAVDGPRFG